jgi:hypothetical protein
MLGLCGLAGATCYFVYKRRVSKIYRGDLSTAVA